jgi:hypothetical protein
MIVRRDHHRTNTGNLRGQVFHQANRQGEGSTPTWGGVSNGGGGLALRSSDTGGRARCSRSRSPACIDRHIEDKDGNGELRESRNDKENKREPGDE